MKRLKIILAVLACLLNSFVVETVLSQQNWSWLNPLPQGNSLNDLLVFDSQTIYTIGDNTTFMKTSDGGVTWKTTDQINGLKLRLASMHFLDRQTGWAVGYNMVDNDSCYILHTAEGGDSWDIQYRKERSYFGSFRKIFFIDNNTGWTIAESGFYKTTDAGQSWQGRYVRSGILDMQFLDANNGWMVTKSDIYRTFNGGQGWTKLNITGLIFTPQWNNLYFFNAQSGYVFGNLSGNAGGIILQITNDGQNYSYQIVGHPISDIWFRDSLHGYIVAGSDIYSTEDGCKSWSNRSPENVNDLCAVKFIDSQTGWAVGLSGEIIKTNDGGSSWKKITLSRFNLVYDNIFDMEMIDENTLFISAEGIRKTTDGGLNWTVQKALSETVLKIKFIDANTGWAVGQGGMILHTTNGGQNWELQSSGTQATLYDIAIIDPNHCWVVGNSGALLKTTDGGQHWIDASWSTYYDMFYIKFFDAQTSWLINEGATYVTSNGGANWILKKRASDISFLTTGYFLNSTTGWIVDGGTDTYYTHDGGSTWEKIDINIYINSFFFLNEKIGWVVGGKYLWGDLIQPGFILSTTDGGINWTEQICPAFAPLNDIVFCNENVGYAIGDYAAILTTKTVVVPPLRVETEPKLVVKDFVLFQNFPNPFNSSTAIEYQLSKSLNVELKIYNVLGQEMKTLVEERQESGKHQFHFNSQGLPTGLYFYRLRAGEFYETKKMLIVK